EIDWTATREMGGQLLYEIDVTVKFERDCGNFFITDAYLKGNHRLPDGLRELVLEDLRMELDSSRSSFRDFVAETVRDADADDYGDWLYEQRRDRQMEEEAA
ncbi:MAG: hypothetical protein ACPGO3_15660, partial [Magnetospiraceae bacterium]